MNDFVSQLQCDEKEQEHCLCFELSDGTYCDECNYHFAQELEHLNRELSVAFLEENSKSHVIRGTTFNDFMRMMDDSIEQDRQRNFGN